MAERAGDPDADADHEVRADGARAAPRRRGAAARACAAMPRIRPTRPPSSPIDGAAERPPRGGRDARARAGGSPRCAGSRAPAQQIEPAVEQDGRDHAEQQVLVDRRPRGSRRRRRPTIDGGAIQPNSRQFTRPARMWVTAAAAAARRADEEVRAAARRRAGRDEQRRGQPDVAEHEADEARRRARRESTRRRRATSSIAARRYLRAWPTSCSRPVTTPRRDADRPSRPRRAAGRAHAPAHARRGRRPASTCSARPRADRAARARSPRGARTRWSSTARRAAARRRSRGSSPARPTRPSRSSAPSQAGRAEVRGVIERADAPPQGDRRADGLLPRRDPPLQQGPAGRAAARRRGGPRDAHRGDDREPVLRGQRARC